MQWLAIGLGAALGACVRAWLARFNEAHPWLPTWLPVWLPTGTLVANVLGGLLMGMMLWLVMHMGDNLSPTIKLFLTTGFLGGLTTFSTFSAEVFTLIQSGQMMAALGLVALHLAMTLCATAVGYYVLYFLI